MTSIVSGLCYAGAMSDIAIRFDGLVLAACLAVGASVFFAIALVTVFIGLAKRRPNASILSDMRRPLLFSLLSATAFGAAIFYMEQSGPPTDGPDWIDWLSLAYLPFLVAGCWAIIRPSR
jgi:hypothetical protein